MLQKKAGSSEAEESKCPFKPYYVVSPKKEDFDFDSIMKTLSPLTELGMHIYHDKENHQILFGDTQYEIQLAVRAVYKQNNQEIKQIFQFHGDWPPRDGASWFLKDQDGQSVVASPKFQSAEDLLAEANAYFAQRDSDIPEQSYLNHFSEIPTKVSPNEFFRQMLYQDIVGLCIGESHTDSGTKKLLIENMEVLKGLGVDTLFLEGLFYDTSLQTCLNDYFNSSNGELPGMLKIQLNELDSLVRPEASPYNYTSLIIAAKQAKIRIVGIDTGVSALCGDPTFKIKERATAMNYVAQTIIQKERGPGKYIVLVGGGHVSKIKEVNVVGLSELIHCPSLRVTKAKLRDKVIKDYTFFFWSFWNGDGKQKYNVGIHLKTEGVVSQHSSFVNKISRFVKRFFGL